MLDPLALNREAIGKEIFPNTWTAPGLEYFKIPFTPRHEWVKRGTADWGAKPVAVHPSFIHARMSAQKSCFTIHGSNNTSLEEQFADSPFLKKGYLRKYIVARDASRRIRNELRVLGISHSMVFPDLDGLSREAKEDFLLEFAEHSDEPDE